MLSRNLIVFCTMFASTQMFAQDLGFIGKTYEIVEKDAVRQIQAKLKQMQDSGELAKVQKMAVEKSLHTMKNPKPNLNIRTATKIKEKLHNPSQAIDHDVITEDGTLLAPAGMSINPLHHISLSKTMVFFDGRDNEQVQAVKKLLSGRQRNFIPILVAGSWYTISKSWQRQVYFDQGGFIARKLEVDEVPALVSQQGDLLKISYVPAKELIKWQ